MASPKVVLITGGNSGVGYEAVKIFLEADKPYHVLLAARSLEKATGAVESIKKECLGAKNTVEALALDVTSDESIKEAFEQVKASPGHVDALINNAGATFDPEFVAGNVSLRDCFNKAYDVNVTGAHVTSWTFMPLLLKPADPRLLFVAGLSHMTVANEGPYFPTPPQPAGWPKQIDFETIGYRCSKTALNMLMLDWNHKLKADGVKVWGVGPGFLATNLGKMKEKVKEMGGGHPSEGGVLYKKVVEGERDDEVGKVIDKDGLVPL
ncbi:hypothetical protein H2199_000572 [Coniosporium tulheliwenetii]|uniref:Uncharacterized protein n=1 Tax=Coniosporium tulheliwenetii TaxID=3383036 RepID=A0ACC2ZQL0_9PEZI|nr:hypothetical protein H2199_000572 [Cladosporium sp. JES 115]